MSPLRVILFFLAGAMVAGPLSAFGETGSGEDHLIIISPHRKSLQEEMVPGFRKAWKKKHGREVKVDWLDQGGTADDIRFIRGRYAQDPKSAGIDIFWGGGTATYTELDRQGVLVPVALSPELEKQIPAKAGSVSLRSPTGNWHATAMSGFGIFYNKMVLQMSRLPTPTTWHDLADPAFEGMISLADPRRSGTTNTLINILLQINGWEKGFQLLTALAANTRQFTHSSSDPIKAVVSGDAAVALTIDFYALAKISSLGTEGLGFVMPAGQTVLDPDPVAMLKGAPHPQVATAFIHYLLSVEAQQKLMLPAGSEGGPERHFLGRFAVNPLAYDATLGRSLAGTNPFKGGEFFPYDAGRSGIRQKVINDLVGTLLIDAGPGLHRAWRHLQKGGISPAELQNLAKMPVSEAGLDAMVTRWDDHRYRNRIINGWTEFATQKYDGLLAH